MDSRIMTQEELEHWLPNHPLQYDKLKQHIAALTEQRDALLKAAKPFGDLESYADAMDISLWNYRALAEAVRKCEE